MEETKHRMVIQKSLYVCDFCGKDIVADCVMEFKAEASTVPVLAVRGDAYIWHRCKESDVVNKLRKSWNGERETTGEF